MAIALVVGTSSGIELATAVTVAVSLQYRKKKSPQ